MKIIINDEIFLLPENESWNIFPGTSSYSDSIRFVRMACNNKYYAFVGEGNAEKVCIAISNEIMTGKNIIKITVNNEIKVESK